MPSEINHPSVEPSSVMIGMTNSPTKKPLTQCQIREWSRGGNRSGFTLVELLVSMAVLALLLVLTAQILNSTLSATTASNKQMDTASMARIALDRFGNDFSSAALSGGLTALYYSGSGGGAIAPSENSAIAFVSKSRARSNPAVRDDVRGLLVGYKIRPTPFIEGDTALVPVFSRGDAAFTFFQESAGASQGGDKYGFSPWSMFGSSSANTLTTDLASSEGADQTLLNWAVMGDGILRFHISFVLDDGRIVQIPPAYKDFSANGGTGNAVPIAFSAETSSDPNRRFVRGLIVGLAVVDEATLRLAYDQDNDFAEALATQLGRPTTEKEAPIAVWNENLTDVEFLPLKQSLRFYQRFYPVNL